MLDFDRSSQTRASDRALSFIREQIVTLEFPPGAVLSDRSISETLSISRTPVREAFIKLADIGLVEVRAQVGTFVSKIGVKETFEANFIRCELEAACAREAAKVATDAHAKSLEFLVGQQGLEQVRLDRRLFGRLDVDFHRKIHEIADNRMCWNIVRDARALVDRIRNLSLAFDPEYDEILSEHGVICRAIAQRQPAAAEKAMRKHINRIWSITKRLETEYPDYFEAAQ